MLSKNTRPAHWKDLTVENRFQANVEDLFAANLVSADRVQSILLDAGQAGVRQLANAAQKRAPPSFKNAARAARKKTKFTFWPEHYVFKGPVWDRKTATVVEEDLAMWLPLELLKMIWKLGTPDVICSTSHMDKQSKAHLEKLQKDLDLPGLFGFGIHGDGVPNNYDRTETANVISINLPGVGGKFARMRIPLCVLPSAKIVPETMDAVLEVVAWSLRHLQAGVNPVARHDGTEWNATTDKNRSKEHGSLGFNASLVEVRGDWDWYSKVFHFPYHGELDGICWRCPCRRKQEMLFLNLVWHFDFLFKPHTCMRSFTTICHEAYKKPHMRTLKSSWEERGPF